MGVSKEKKYIKEVLGSELPEFKTIGVTSFRGLQKQALVFQEKRERTR